MTAWHTDPTTGIAMPQTREEWWRFINAHGLKMEPPDSAPRAKEKP